MFRLSILLAACVGLAGCRTGEDRAARERLEEWWQLYQQDAEGWPEVRDRWYALGGDEQGTLVLTLIQDLVARAPQPVRTEHGFEPGWKKPQRDLLSLPAEGVVPVLEEALRAGRDNVSLEALADTLAGFGAVDALVSVLDDPREGDTAAARRHALTGLVKAGGEKAISRLGRLLREEPDWAQRASAAEALGNARYADSARAAQALVQALEDDDPFVFKKVCESLARLEVATSAPPLAYRLERALREKDDTSARWLVLALRRVTGATVADDDPTLWREVAERTAARGA